MAHIYFKMVRHHNPKVGGSNPSPATIKIKYLMSVVRYQSELQQALGQHEGQQIAYLDREIVPDGEIAISTFAATTPGDRWGRARLPIDTHATFAEHGPLACYTFFTHSGAEAFPWLL
jgi:hypothetical protein